MTSWDLLVLGLGLASALLWGSALTVWLGLRAAARSKGRARP